MRKTFHDELKDLKKETLKMGHLVENSIKDAIKALVTTDLDLAKKVMEGDDKIDDLMLYIEEESMAILARQAPVAKDLRLVYSVQFIALNLERMGDLSSNICRIIKYLAREEKIQSLLDLITQMGELTSEVVGASLEAFEKKDLELAMKLPDMDEPIDDLFKEFFKELSRVAASKKVSSLEWASNMVLTNRYLERIADRAVDIGERVAYLVTGEMKELD